MAEFMSTTPTPTSSPVRSSSSSSATARTSTPTTTTTTSKPDLNAIAKTGNTDDLFASLKDSYGLNSMGEDTDDDELLGEGLSQDEMDLNSDHPDGDDNDPEISTDSADDNGKYGGLSKEEFDALPLHEFVDATGKTHTFHDEATLNKALERSNSATKMAEAYKALKAESAKNQIHLENYREIDNLMRNNPRELLDLITEDMDDSVVESYLLDKAQYFRMPEDQRKQVRDQRAAQNVLTEQRAQAAAKERARAAAAEQARNADESAVGAWIDSNFEKWAPKVPPEYKGFLDRQIKLLLQEAKLKLDSGHEIYLQDMSNELESLLRPLLAKTSPQRMAKERGAAADVARRDAVSRVQNAASPQAGRRAPAVAAKVASSDDIFAAVRKKWGLK